MEVTTQKIRIRNYIRYSIRKAKKEAEIFYTENYNPFYNWHIGKLNGEAIIEEINYYNSNKHLSDRVKLVNSTTKDFSLLISIYKDAKESNNLEDLTNDEWLKIRRIYEREINKEQIDIIKKYVYFENTKPTDIASGDIGLNAEVSDEISETIQEEVELLLDLIHQGNWVSTVRKIRRDPYNFLLVVINIHLPPANRDKILVTAAESLRMLFKENYGENEFILKHIEDHTFIEGHFIYEE